jgi:acetylornithine deacetylase/succinyl-diaminopimelate desuccinylase-like protein
MKPSQLSPIYKRGVSALVLAVALVAIDSTAQVTSVREYRRTHEAEIIAEFAQLLSIPNVASDTTNIRLNASRLVEMMAQRGIESKLLEGKGPPAVYGSLKTPGANLTVGIYAHYDGQPVEPAKWATDPFRPVLRSGLVEAGAPIIEMPKKGDPVNSEWRIYARSASDDKGAIICCLTALDALKSAGRRPSVNLKFLFDGEEEAGSPNLLDIVKRNANELGADIWLCADGPVHQSRRQQLYFGVRGVVKVDITVYGATRALHSGHYGNWAPNPAMRLARLLASMKDDTGKVLVDGFYDGVEPLGQEELRALREMPDTDAQLMRELGLASTDSPGHSLAELINRPSLNIDGLRSEDVGPQSRTIIPAEATATIDLRLVKGIEPKTQVDRLIAHIRKQGYFVTSEEPNIDMRLAHPLIARVTAEQGYPAVRTSMSLPIVKRVIDAVTKSLNQRPILLPTMGGSGPLWIIEEATGAPQVGVPIANHDNNQHSSNENLRLQNLWDGIEVFAGLMTIN